MSRLAVRSGCLNALEFCSSHNALFGDVIRGDDLTINSLAEAAGVSLPELQRHSLSGVHADLSLGGVSMPKSSLCRAEIRACPLCLQDDIRCARVPAVAAYGRSWWHVLALRTCPDHGMALATLSIEPNRSRAHDLARRYEPFLRRLDRIAISLQSRDQSGLEQYIHARLLKPCTGNKFLDSLPLHVVAKTSEAIGFRDTCEGRRPWNTVDSDGWWRAGQVGFDILKGGQADLTEWIRDRRGATNKRSHSSELGTFYRWLTHAGVAFDPIRAIAAEQIMSTTALSENAVVFGVRLEARRLWSVTSACNAFGIGADALMRLLAQNGITPSATSGSLDDILFPASEKFDLAIHKFKNCITLNDAQKFLQLSRTETKSLIGMGLITPISSRINKEVVRLWKPNLKVFVSSVMNSAIQRGACHRSSHLTDLMHGTRYLSISFGQLISAVLDNRLTVYRSDKSESISSLYADAEDIRRLRSEIAGYSAREVARILKADDRVVDALVSNKYLDADSSPIKKGHMRIISKESIDSFLSNYVIISALASQIGVSPFAFRTSLQKNGCQSIFITSSSYKMIAKSVGQSREMGCYLTKITDLKKLSGKIIILRKGKRKLFDEELLENSVIF
ncbi:TniQ family protein [Methylobacterium sp. J-048]|nr:TniQ family protein [Methylobacterium sp. J-048]